MNRFFCSLIGLFLCLCGYAQQEHGKFDGIPMGGDFSTFKKALINKGYKFEWEWFTGDNFGFSRVSNGKKMVYEVNTMPSGEKLVYQVRMKFDYMAEEEIGMDEVQKVYDEVVKSYEKKYGKPNRHGEFIVGNLSIMPIHDMDDRYSSFLTIEYSDIPTRRLFWKEYLPGHLAFRGEDASETRTNDSGRSESKSYSNESASYNNNSNKHCTFEGVPLGQDLMAFRINISKKGYFYDRALTKYKHIFSSTTNGKKKELHVLISLDQRVFCVEEHYLYLKNNPNLISSEYSKLRKTFTEKYGMTVNKENECTFGNSYQMICLDKRDGYIIASYTDIPTLKESSEQLSEYERERDRERSDDRAQLRQTSPFTEPFLGVQHARSLLMEYPWKNAQSGVVIRFKYDSVYVNGNYFGAAPEITIMGETSFIVSVQSPQHGMVTFLYSNGLLSQGGDVYYPSKTG